MRAGKGHSAHAIRRRIALAAAGAVIGCLVLLGLSHSAASAEQHATATPAHGRRPPRCRPTYPSTASASRRTALA